MNAQSDETQGLNLPRPTFDRTESALPSISDVPEPFQGQITTSSWTSQVSPSNPVAIPSLTAPAAAVPQMDYEGVVADDEWIERARDIVERTQADPYTLSREISRIKAEYVKARYNKDIKVVEE